MRMDRDSDGQGGKAQTGVITVEFVSGETWQYPNRSIADFVDMVESSSKGRFAYYEIRGPGPSSQVKGRGLWPGTKIRDAWRSAAEIKRIRHARRPITAAQKQRTYTRYGKRGGYGAGGLAIR